MNEVAVFAVAIIAVDRSTHVMLEVAFASVVVLIARHLVRVSRGAGLLRGVMRPAVATCRRIGRGLMGCWVSLLVGFRATLLGRCG
jgi:hypothetical protein